MVQRIDGKVALNCGGGLLQRAGSARDERDVAAGFGEAAGDRTPDAARCARDDHGWPQQGSGLESGLRGLRVAGVPGVERAAHSADACRCAGGCR